MSRMVLTNLAVSASVWPRRRSWWPTRSSPRGRRPYRAGGVAYGATTGNYLASIPGRRDRRPRFVDWGRSSRRKLPSWNDDGAKEGSPDARRTVTSPSLPNSMIRGGKYSLGRTIRSIDDSLKTVSGILYQKVIETEVLSTGEGTIRGPRSNEIHCCSSTAPHYSGGSRSLRESGGRLRPRSRLVSGEKGPIPRTPSALSVPADEDPGCRSLRCGSRGFSETSP